MNTFFFDHKKSIVHTLFMMSAIFATFPIIAADLYCTGQQMGELFIDTTAGSVTKSAEETLKVEIITENSHYRFVFKGKKSQFKAIINRQNSQIILEEACTPDCWGGPIFGTCTPIKAKI